MNCLERTDAATPVGPSVGQLKRQGPLSWQEARARANMYGFLSNLFLIPPSQELIKWAGEDDRSHELSAAFGEKAAAELKAFAEDFRLQRDTATVIQDYWDLFRIPTGRYVAPFEDVYRGTPLDGKKSRGPLLGKHAIAVIRTYREAGAVLDERRKELPTHIGIEFAFMRFLCEQEASALGRSGGHLRRFGGNRKPREDGRYLELQGRFLGDHLNRWFPRLAQEICSNSQSRFYPGWISIAEAFLLWDTAALSNPRAYRNP